MRKHQAIVRSCLLALLVLLALRCKKEDPPEEPGPKMTCKVDGVAWEAVSFTNELTIGWQSSWGFHVKNLWVRGTAADGTQVLFSVDDFRDGSEGECIRTDTYFSDARMNPCSTNTNGIPYCVRMIGTYVLNDSTYFITRTDTAIGEVTVTECDPVNHTLSGTFWFEGWDWQQVGPEHYITEGVFDKVVYAVD